MIDKKQIRVVTALCEPEDETICLECACYECPVITCEIRKKNWSEHCSKTGECPMVICASEIEGENEGNNLVSIYKNKKSKTM